MKITAGSDLHGLLMKPSEIPDGDVLCLCGDIVPLVYQRDLAQSVSWFCLKFLPWMDSLPHKKVILIGGNHDFFLESVHTRVSDCPELTWRTSKEAIDRLLPDNIKSRYNKLVYLCDSSYTLDGVRFYGIPYIEQLKNWAFYRHSDNFEQICENIPKTCDVLLTHMPPRIADCGLVKESGWNCMNDYGSETLAEAVKTRNIKYALCGHVHSGNHIPTTVDGTTYVNVSLLGEDYKHRYDWTCIEIVK